jgi:hypothetical protein
MADDAADREAAERTDRGARAGDISAEAGVGRREVQTIVARANGPTMRIMESPFS